MLFTRPTSLTPLPLSLPTEIYTEPTFMRKFLLFRFLASLDIFIFFANTLTFKANDNCN